MSDVLLVGEPRARFIADEVGPLEEVVSFHKALAGAEVNVAIGSPTSNTSIIYLPSCLTTSISFAKEHSKHIHAGFS